MIQVTKNISIAEDEIEEHFIRAPGPGGQNVNKVESAVQIRFDAAASPNLPEEILPRLRRLAGRRMTGAGVILLTARKYRSQERNRQDGLQRILELIQKASVRPRTRKPTKPSGAARRRRMERKKKRGDIKKTRGKVNFSD